MKKDFLALSDLSYKELNGLLELTCDIKKNPYNYKDSLLNKTLAMIFMKNSTRTRVSFETGIFQMGGAAIFLSSKDIQLSRGESIHDTAKVLSRYVDGIMIRTFDHNEIIELAKYSTVPVINGLTDLLHPCQAFTDCFTIFEKKGDLSGLKITYMGDGNNMANSLMIGAAKFGMNITIISPEKYAPNNNIIHQAIGFASEQKSLITITEDINAVDGSDIVYTDTWTSMGQEAESAERKNIFMKYQVNKALMKKAKPDAIFMHCLPAHRGEEVTDEVMDSPNSVVFDQAENRLHCQKAIMFELMGKK